MKTIREHIKNGTFSRCYLLYGKDDYMVRLYRDKLVEALTVDGDSMNYHSFRGDNCSLLEVRDIAETVPFFADRRLLLIQDSGWFKKSFDCGTLISDIPDTTVMLFVEDDVDKASSLYKAVKEYGYVSEMNGLTEEELRLFIGSLFSRNKLKITSSNADFLLNRVGSDMNQLSVEVDKLSSFCMGRQEVTRDDILRITSPVIEGQIFAMMDAIMANDRAKATALYTELLSAQEKPLRILYMLTNNFFSFYKVLSLADIGTSADDIAAILELRSFVVKKFLKQKRNWSFGRVLHAVEEGNDMERRIKSGDLEEHMAVEMFLFKYTDARK